MTLNELFNPFGLSFLIYQTGWSFLTSQVGGLRLPGERILHTGGAKCLWRLQQPPGGEVGSLSEGLRNETETERVFIPRSGSQAILIQTLNSPHPGPWTLSCLVQHLGVGGSCCVAECSQASLPPYPPRPSLAPGFPFQDTCSPGWPSVLQSGHDFCALGGGAQALAWPRTRSPCRWPWWTCRTGPSRGPWRGCRRV